MEVTEDTPDLRFGHPGSRGRLVIVRELLGEFSIRRLGAALGALPIGSGEAGDPILRIRFPSQGGHATTIVTTSLLSMVSPVSKITLEIEFPEALEQTVGSNPCLTASSAEDGFAACRRCVAEGTFAGSSP
jgi:hypothetical protein